MFNIFPDSKVPGANMGPTWVLSAPDVPHVSPMNLAIRVSMYRESHHKDEMTDISSLEWEFLNWWYILFMLKCPQGIFIFIVLISYWILCKKTPWCSFLCAILCSKVSLREISIGTLLMWCNTPTSSRKYMQYDLSHLARFGCLTPEMLILYLYKMQIMSSLYLQMS